MTIVFSGHITKTSTEGPTGFSVTIYPERAACEQMEITLFVPRRDAAHWLPGRQISATIYAFSEPPAILAAREGEEKG
jgi:hypothetical protein